MNKLLASSFAVLAAFLLPACGDAGASSVAGVYHLDTDAFLEQMSEQMKGMPDDARKQQIDAVKASIAGSIELKADGSAAMQIKMMMVDEAATGTWKRDGDTITITAKGKEGPEEAKVVKFADGVLTIEEREGDQTMRMLFRRK